MSGGGSSGSSGGTTVQKTEPWDAAKPYYKDLYQTASDAYKAINKEGYTGQLVADQSADTISAQNTMRDLIPALQTTGTNAMTLANNTMSGNYLNAESNPYLQSAVAAATRDYTKEFQNEIVPAINSSAIAQGAYGGARQGIALGNAADDATQNLSDTIAKMYYQNYATERGYQNTAPTMASTAESLASAPATAYGQVGSSINTYEQSLLDAALAQYNANQLAPYTGLAEYASILNGGGFNTSYGQINSNSNKSAANWLSGALGGGSLGFAVGGPIGAGVGAAGGALMGGLL